ncbi:MAG TPA: hypothetical protein VD973_25230, partial [Symbiobacteriaceae bacterium]|nr:hypothetical protein [Symbiobacteriaceae bacterium]
MKWPSTMLVLLMTVLTGCTGDPKTVPPPGTTPDPGRMCQVEKLPQLAEQPTPYPLKVGGGPLRPGKTFTLTVEGDNLTRGVDAYLECWNGKAWIPQFVLLSWDPPKALPYKPDLAIEDIGFDATQPGRFVLPAEISPGWYRLRLDVSGTENGTYKPLQLATPIEVVGAGVDANPVYPQDQVVLQLAHGGGFRMPDRVSNEIPDVTIWGNGRVVFAAPDGTVRDGRLSPDVVSRLVNHALLLYDLDDEYAAAQHTDDATATFTVLTERGRKTVSVYALHPMGTEVPGQFASLAALWQAAQAALPADAPALVPSAVDVRTYYAVEPVTGDWPAELTGRLTGEAAQRAVALAGMGEAKVFRVGDQVQRVLVIPVLPGPGAWDTVQKVSGEAQDETIALTARGAALPDGSFRVSALITNRSEQGVQLLFNCGSLVFWDGLPAPAPGPGTVVACP